MFTAQLPSKTFTKNALMQTSHQNNKYEFCCSLNARIRIKMCLVLISNILFYQYFYVQTIPNSTAKLTTAATYWLELQLRPIPYFLINTQGFLSGPSFHVSSFTRAYFTSSVIIHVSVLWQVLQNSWIDRQITTTQTIQYR